MKIDIDIARGKVRLPRVGALGDLVPGPPGAWWEHVFLPNAVGWAHDLHTVIFAGSAGSLRDTLEKLLELHEKG